MLKIKDSVDLKELEKFGFYCDEEITIENKKYDVWVKSVFTAPRDYSEIFYSIDDATRIIKIITDGTLRLDNTIYELIKADLVEEVDKHE